MVIHIFQIFIFVSLVILVFLLFYYRNPKIEIECRIVDKKHEKTYGMGGYINSFSATINYGDTVNELHILKMSLYNSLVIGEKGLATFRGNFLMKFKKNENN